MFRLHSRCESIETSLRARVSDLEAEIDRVREAASARETDLFNRLLALTNPAALAATVAANRSSGPALNLNALPIRQSKFPNASAFRERQAVAGGASPLLRPPDQTRPAAPETPASIIESVADTTLDR